MSTLLPEGHVSVALAVVYTIAKQLHLEYSIDQWKQNTNEGFDPEEWPKISIDDEEDPQQFVFPYQITWFRSLNHEDTSTNFNCVNMSFSKYITDKIVDNSIYLYPPYTTIGSEMICGINRKTSIRLPSSYWEIWRFSSWLRKHLRNGKLVSYVTLQTGRVLRVPENFWLSNQADDVLKYDVSTLISLDNGDCFGRISVDCSNVMGLFQPKTGGNLEATTTTPIPPNAELILQAGSASVGRPQKYSEVDFMMEATRIVLNGFPDTQKEMREKVCDAYKAAGHRGGRPDEAWAKKKISYFWRTLKLKGEGEKLG